jgi:hypothetical protein
MTGKQNDAMDDATSSRWAAVKRIFAAARTKPHNRRPGFVRQACAGDSQLELEVLELLAADDSAGAFLESQQFPSNRTQSDVPPRGRVSPPK